MKTPRIVSLLVASVLLAAGVDYLHDRVAPSLFAQGYSGALPNVVAASGTSLRATYTAGSIPLGGSTQAITADATGLLTTASKTDCAAPTYTSCNIIYWTSGTALATTTNVLTAFKPGNVVVAFVTTTGGDISAVYPVSWNPAQPPVTLTDLYAVVPPSACVFTYTTTAVDTGFPKFQRPAAGQVVYSTQTDTVAGTITYDCDLSSALSQITAGGRPATITGLNFLYAPVTTTLTSMANPVMKTVTGPAAGGAAAGTVADACGTLTFDPSTIQTTAISAGTFYTLNVSCGTPLALTSGVQYLGFGGSMVHPAGTQRFDIGTIVVLYKTVQ